MSVDDMRRAILQNTELYDWQLLLSLSPERILELYEKFCEND